MKRKYKVLFLNSISENVWGGGENWLFNCATHLQKKGHKIWVAGRKNSEFLNHFPKDKINLVPLNIRGDFDPLNILSLVRLLQKEKIDFFWVNFNKDLRIGGTAARIAKSAKLIWRMGVLLPETSFVHRITGRYLPEKIVVPCQSLKDQLKRFPWIKPEKVTVIPNGIDLSCFDFDLREEREKLFQRYNLDPRTTLIGVPARLAEAKGHVYLLKAIPEIIQAFPEVKFFLAGDGSEMDYLKDLSRQLKLDNSIIFASYIREIFETMAGFDLLVLPSISEGFGGALAEGMALQKPIVSTLVGGIPEIVQDSKTGILTPPKDPHSLARAIITLLENKNLASRLGEAGRERVESFFTIQKMIKRIESLFDEMTE